MIFRLSQKLNNKIKAGTPGDMPPDENPYADWSCHLFIAHRVQYFLLSNTPSLYSCVMYGQGISDDGRFIDKALGTIRDFTTDDGQQFVYRKFIAPASATVHFAKSLNRSVTGSMNDLIYHAKVWLIEGELSPHEVGLKLNEIPMSAIKDPNGRKYAYPREVFKLLLSRTKHE